MNEEKILFFLNLNTTQTADKSLSSVIKALFWFDMAFSITIVIFGLLVKYIVLSWFNIAIIFSFIVTDIFLGIGSKYQKNVTTQFSYIGSAHIITFFKLIYGYIVFSRGEFNDYGYAIYSIVHSIILSISILISIFVIYRFYLFFRLLKIYTIEETVKKINKKNEKYNWFVIIISCIASTSPFLWVRGFDNVTTKAGLGAGFGFWGLACLWICMLCCWLPKCIVSKSYAKNK